MLHLPKPLIPEAVYKPNAPIFSKIFAETIFEDYISVACDLQDAQNDKIHSLMRLK